MTSRDMYGYHKLRRFALIGLSAVFGASLLFYAYYQSRNFISGPKIEIVSPENGATVRKAPVEIEGTAEKIARLELNGNQIFVDENNRFSEKLLLMPGYNIITLQATDKFKRVVKKSIEVVLLEEYVTHGI